MTTKQAKVKCPECGAEYNTAKGLSSHRRSMHGVAGSGRTVIAARKKAQAAADPLQCPECGNISKNKTLLGVHRSRVHGIAGMSKAAIVERQRRLIATVGVKIDTNNPLQCQICGFIAGNQGGLSIHRRAAHRPLEEVPALPEPAQVEEIETSVDPLQCQLCSFHAANQGGLKLHTRKAHENRKPTRREIEPAQAIQISTSNGSKNQVLHAAEESHVVADGIPEATLALALGRFQELCRSMAYEHDLPARMFTRRVAGLIYAATVR